MNHRVLITGSRGLVGTALEVALSKVGAEVALLDIAARGLEQGDVCDFNRVRAAVDRCDGVVHLAAVSRVIWGERDPELCWATNVGGLRNVLHAAVESDRAPWVIFASSREVYGQPQQLPVDEDCPVRPVNVYGRSKVEGERLIKAANENGVRACTVRLSNVFGSINDHADRVVPAFAQGATLGRELRVDGADHTFDFTHIDDICSGLATLVELMARGGTPPPPIQFVSGVRTTLEELALLAIQLAESNSTVCYAPPRDFDVARFVGSHTRATQVLGWTPHVSLTDGLHRLIRDFRDQFGTGQHREVAQ